MKTTTTYTIKGHNEWFQRLLAYYYNVYIPKPIVYIDPEQDVIGTNSVNIKVRYEI